MVCPYGWDTPGGVQTHIRDLTQHLIDEGHYVSVLAPISDDSISHEDYVVNAGKPISIPVNGSVELSLVQLQVHELSSGLPLVILTFYTYMNRPFHLFHYLLVLLQKDH